MGWGHTGINIGEGFFQIVGEQGHTFGYLDRLAILFISFFCATKGCTQKLLLLFIFYLDGRG